MEEIFKHPDQVQYWQAVAAGKTVDWNEVFRSYRAQVDWPGAHVWPELAVAYPEAKVVHSIRPETVSPLNSAGQGAFAGSACKKHR